MSQVVVLVRVVAQPLAEAELKAELLDLARASRDDAGCLSFEVFESLNDDAALLVHEVWQDRDALAAHDAAEHTAAFKRRLPALAAKEPTVVVAAL